MKLKGYSGIIKQLKSAILASRYKAAVVANKELLALYFNVGQLITEKEKQGKWGDKILMQLSADLQHELPGLKGFSATNIKRMKLFYQQRNTCFAISPMPSDQLQKRGNKVTAPVAFLISPLLTAQLEKKSKKQAVPDKIIIGQSSTDQFSPSQFTIK